jgi:hypothetical protein
MKLAIVIGQQNMRRVHRAWAYEQELIELDRKITNSEANLQRLYTERANRCAALVGPLPLLPISDSITNTGE